MNPYNVHADIGLPALLIMISIMKKVFLDIGLNTRIK